MSQPPPPPPPSQPPGGDPPRPQPEGSGATPEQPSLSKDSSGAQAPPPPGQPPQQPPGGFGAPSQQPPHGGGYGYPQQPPQGAAPAGGYGYPQQPQGGPQPGAYGFPQQQPQGAYAYPQQHGAYPQQYGQPGPYGPGPGMYPTAPPGGYGPGGPGVPGGGGSGNGKVIAVVIAAVVAVVLVVGTVGFFLLKDDGGGGPSATDGEDSTSSGGGGKPANAEGKELFKIEAPKITGDDAKRALGGWATDKVFVKGTVDGLVAMDVASGKKAWDIPLDGEICAAAKQVTKSGKTAVVTAENSSSTSSCNQLVVIDLKSGKKAWQKKMPDDRTTTRSVSMTISQNVVAAQWIGGSAAYKMSGGSPLWTSEGNSDCRDEGYSGGKDLMAVVACGDYSDPKIKVQKLNPKTGKSTWEFEAPSGVESARVISSDPVVLAVGAGTSVPTDVMTVGDDGKLKAKISLGDHKYDPGCSTEVESCSTAVADKKYIYMPSGQHQGDATSTNEILAFDVDSGKPRWKSDAGESRTIVPLRMDGGKLIAYKKPTYDAGGQVVAVDPATHGKQEIYLRNPDDGARTESNLASISLRDAPLYVNGRLFLQRSLVSKSSQGSYGKYIGVGYGAR